MRLLILALLPAFVACGGEAEPPPAAPKPVRKNLKKPTDAQSESKNNKRVAEQEFSRGKLERDKK